MEEADLVLAIESSGKVPSPSSFDLVCLFMGGHISNKNDHIWSSNDHIWSSNDHIWSSNDHIWSSNDHIWSSNGQNLYWVVVCACWVVSVNEPVGHRLQM